MKNSEIRIARIMSENARCEEEEKEINWCIDEAKESKYNPKIKQHIRTFYEAVEWCGLEDQYHKAEKQIEAERAELKTVFKILLSFWNRLKRITMNYKRRLMSIKS